MSLLYIRTACIRSSNSFSFLAKSCMSSMYISWRIFSCDFVNLYLPVHFLTMWLSGIIAIRNSNDNSASPWNIPHWTFTSAKLFPLVVNSTLQASMFFSKNFMTSSDILFILRHCITHLEGQGCMPKASLLLTHSIARFFHLDLLSLRMCWSIYCKSSVTLVPLRHNLCSSGNSWQL